MNISFVDLTPNIEKYRDKIDIFLKDLDTEKEFIGLNVKRLIKSELVFAALHKNEIIGISGLQKKHGISRRYTVLRRDYQGKGLGKKFSSKILAHAKKDHNIIMSVIDENNLRALKMASSMGYKKAGRRRDLLTLLLPLNFKGFFLFYLIRLLFPLYRFLDVFRPIHKQN
jgi:RimJ/RimL family protein N-acetyltransferase